MCSCCCRLLYVCVRLDLTVASSSSCSLLKGRQKGGTCRVPPFKHLSYGNISVSIKAAKHNFTGDSYQESTKKYNIQFHSTPHLPFLLFLCTSPLLSLSLSLAYPFCAFTFRTPIIHTHASIHRK